MKLAWAVWELDSSFFTVLSQWTSEHPQMTLNQGLTNIQTGLESGQTLSQLIPACAFPNQSLVGALGVLVELSMVPCFHLIFPS